MLSGAQLVFPLAATVRDRAPDAVVADVALVLALQTAILVAGMILPATTAAQETGTGRGPSPSLSWPSARRPPAMCSVSWRRRQPLRRPCWRSCWSLSGGRLSDVELLLGIFAAFSAAMVVAVQPRQAKGAYFAAARLLTAALAMVVSFDITASGTAISLTVACVLAFQHIVRWFMRHRLEQVPFQDAAVWLTLAAQAALPALYVIQGGGAAAIARPRAGGVLSWWSYSCFCLARLPPIGCSRHAGRSTCVCTLACSRWSQSGPALSSGQEQVLAAPLLSWDGVPLTLLAASLAFNVAGLVRRRHSDGRREASVDRWFWLAGAAVPALSAGLAGGQAADWITGATLLVLAATGFTASHTERIPLLYPPAALLVLAGATLIAGSVFRGTEGEWGSYLPWLTGCVPAALVLYGAGFALRNRDGVRRRTLASAAVFGLAVQLPAAGVVSDATSLTAALLVAATVSVAVQEVPLRARRLTLEIGAFLVTVAVQRASYITEGHLNAPFWAVQWYVLLAAALAAMRFAAGFRPAGRILLGSGAALLGLSGLGILFGGSGGQQLWVLALTAPAVSGLGFGERLFVWWGAGGVALCLMWAIRLHLRTARAHCRGPDRLAVWRLARSKPVAPAGAGREPGGPTS